MSSETKRSGNPARSSSVAMIAVTCRVWWAHHDIKPVLPKLPTLSPNRSSEYLSELLLVARDEGDDCLIS